MERPTGSNQEHLPILHKVCYAYNPNLTYLLDNVNSDEDGCSDVDEDCIPIDDTLLDVSAIPANTTCHNPGREQERKQSSALLGWPLTVCKVSGNGALHLESQQHQHHPVMSVTLR